MKYKVDKNIRPVYLQIYKQIKDDIINGNFPYNAKLPSKRLLADETETSTVTIEHAYALLCDEGYVESRERSGFFVIFRNTDGFALPSVTEIHESEIMYEHHTSPNFPFSVLAKTMRNVISDFGEAILEKTQNKGSAFLQKRIPNEFPTEMLKIYRSRYPKSKTCVQHQIILGNPDDFHPYIQSLLQGHRQRLHLREHP